MVAAHPPSSITNEARLDSGFRRNDGRVVTVDEDNNELVFDDVLEEIVNIITRKPGIEVTEYKVITLEDINAKDFLDMQLFDFDYLSYKDKPRGKTINRHGHL